MTADRVRQDGIYNTYFRERMLALLEIGTTPQYFKLSRVYWWTLYAEGIINCPPYDTCSKDPATVPH